MEHMEQERKVLLEKLEDLEGHGPSRTFSMSLPTKIEQWALLLSTLVGCFCFPVRTWTTRSKFPF
jgi:hypothetical protein